MWKCITFLSKEIADLFCLSFWNAQASAKIRTVSESSWILTKCFFFSICSGVNSHLEGAPLRFGEIYVSTCSQTKVFTFAKWQESFWDQGLCALASSCHAESYQGECNTQRINQRIDIRYLNLKKVALCIG